MVFKSKIDLWLAILLLGAAAFPVVAITRMHLPPDLGTRHVSVLLSLIMPAMIVAALFRTEYAITEEAVIVRSGFFTTRIPLSSILQVVPTRSLLYGPALSMDRLAIQYDTKLVRTVCRVSPCDKLEFLQELRARGIRAA
mgnify:CR=1 FL=1